jgi:dipeptidase E
MKPKQIVAIGGGLFEDPARAIERYVLKQTGKRRPRVVFFPHASDDNVRYRYRFYQAMAPLNCELSTLSLFDTPPVHDMAGFVLSHDAILVGGGNTVSMLGLWRLWGLDKVLRTAYTRGIVLAGVSAGANCWFEQCVTDSARVELSAIDCLGFLKGAFCPHYDSEAGRRPTLHQLVGAGALSSTVACDDYAAAHFVDGALHGVISSREGAGGYQVSRKAGRVVEAPLAARRLR